jgi:hypothetical protein
MEKEKMTWLTRAGSAFLSKCSRYISELFA